MIVCRFFKYSVNFGIFRGFQIKENDRPENDAGEMMRRLVLEASSKADGFLILQTSLEEAEQFETANLLKWILSGMETSFLLTIVKAGTTKFF